MFVVGTETWVNKIENYPFDEFVYMYQGEAVVKPVYGSTQVFYSGDYFFAPRGFKGDWEIRGNHQAHYELSVIATSRADSNTVHKNPQHLLFSKADLSGNDIEFDLTGNYEELLHQGAELTVKLKSELPQEKSIAVEESEQIIHLLSGQLIIIDEKQLEHQFYTGDYFILPRGFKGQWKSDGHQLIKYLTVERSKY